MTLVLVWNGAEGVTVVADTYFGGRSEVAAQAGPKIFSIPIVLNRWRDGHVETEKHRLPAMGFAFAGNTFSGQAAHGLATTCLQNLVAHEFDDGPTVEEVAELYARCAKLVVDERRGWSKTDAHCFDAVIFGRSNPRSASQAFILEVQIGEDGTANCVPTEIDFSVYVLFALGSGEGKAIQMVEEARRLRQPVAPDRILQAAIEDPDVPTVDGNQQFAISTPSGVELRPILKLGGESDFEFQIMGFEIGLIGSIGKYSPTATHAAISYGRPEATIEQAWMRFVHTHKTSPRLK
jgi:hypothetical protein